MDLWICIGPHAKRELLRVGVAMAYRLDLYREDGEVNHTRCFLPPDTWRLGEGVIIGWAPRCIPRIDTRVLGSA